MAISIDDFTTLYNDTGGTLGTVDSGAPANIAALSPIADISLSLITPSNKYLTDTSPTSGDAADTQIRLKLNVKGETDNSPILAHYMVTYHITFPESGSSTNSIIHRNVYSLPTNKTGSSGASGTSKLSADDFQSLTFRSSLNSAHSDTADSDINKYLAGSDIVNPLPTGAIPKGSSVRISCQTLWAQLDPDSTTERLWFKKSVDLSKELHIVVPSVPVIQQSSMMTVDKNILSATSTPFSQLPTSSLLTINGESFVNKIAFSFRGEYIQPYNALSGAEGNPAFKIELSEKSDFSTIAYDTGDEDNSDIDGFISFTPKKLDGSTILNTDETIPVFSQSFTPTLATALESGFTYFWRLTLRNDEGESVTATESFELASEKSVSAFSIVDNTVISPTFNWIYNTPAEQQFVRIRISEQISGSLVYDETFQQFTTSKTITSDLLKFNVAYNARIFISDGKTIASSSTLPFTLSSKPFVRGLKVDGKINPTDVVSGTPLFSWVFQSSGLEPQTKFQIQVGTTLGGSDLLDTGLISGSSTSYTYSGSPIPTKTTIYFRIRAQGNGPVSDYTNGTFVVATRPNMPILLTPNGGERSNTSISITWSEASPIHPDGDPVTYTLQYTENKFNPVWITIVDEIPEGTTTYIWDVTEVKRGDLYAVKIFADDGVTTSVPDISDTVFSITNHIPNTPTLDEDITGGVFRHIMNITWTEADPLDVDGDPIFYELELLVTSYPSESIELLARLSSGVTEYMLDLSQYPDGSNYRLRLSAVSIFGDRSEYDITGFFIIDNTPSALDFISFNGETFLALSDGRIVKIVRDAFNSKTKFNTPVQQTNWIRFQSGESISDLKNNHLLIESPEGSTLIFKHD